MYILFAILIFSFLIFIHEFGHFITAKLSGVQVNEFSMFMGPAIWKKQKGETLYSIRCIPFGGYCAMEGENEDTDNPRSFQKAPWWKRLLILVAGSGMNFIAGVLIMVIVFLPAQMVVPTVDSYEPESKIFGESGLQVGDTFLEIDGEPVENANDFSEILSRHPGDVHDLVVERNGQKIVFDDFLMEKVEFEGETSPRYGFKFATADMPLSAKLTGAWDEVVYSAKAVWMSLGMLVSGEAGLSDMSGPVGIVGMMNETAQASETWVDALINMLYFGAFIAINLAIMNLLPIPALDGGRVFALLITTAIVKITKKPVNPKIETYIHGVGMILLLGFMAIIMFKDVFVIFKG